MWFSVWIGCLAIATLDCYKKEVKLHRLGKLEVNFTGIRRELSSSLISTMAA